MFQSDLLIWWFVRIWEYPVLQIFYSWDLIKTTLTSAHTAFHPSLHTLPSLCTWAILSCTASAFSISCFWAAIIWTNSKTISMFTFWSFYMFKVYEKYYVKYVEGIKVINVIATTAVICRGTFSFNPRGFTNCVRICVPSSIFRGSN